MKVVIALFMVLCGAPAEAGKKKDRDAFSRPRVSRAAPPQLKQKLMTHWTQCTSGKPDDCMVLGESYEKGHGLTQSHASVSYTHLTLPTNREV